MGPLVCNPFDNPWLPAAAATPVIILLGAIAHWAAIVGAAAAFAISVPAFGMMATQEAAYPPARGIISAE